MDTAKCTPRPWVARKANTVIYIRGADGHIVGSMTTRPPRVPEVRIRATFVERANNDPRLIVTAVNNYERMRDALVHAKRVILQCPNAPYGHEMMTEIDIALAGLEDTCDTTQSISE